MPEPFDELSKTLAQDVSRREALRRVGRLAATAMLASLGLPEPAWARGECRRLCTGFHPGPGNARDRVQCIRDCDACRATCPDLDPSCLVICSDVCRARCTELGFPAGRQRDYCVLVCAQCQSRQGGLCYTDEPRGRVARCCCPTFQFHCPSTEDPEQFSCCDKGTRVNPPIPDYCCPNASCHAQTRAGEFQKCCPSGEDPQNPGQHAWIAAPADAVCCNYTFPDTRICPAGLECCDEVFTPGYCGRPGFCPPPPN